MLLKYNQINPKKGVNLKLISIGSITGVNCTAQTCSQVDEEQ